MITRDRARRALAWAVDSAIEHGTPPPCARLDSAAWISEDEGERAEAAQACHGCPVWDACAAAGRYERHNVWAGVDRTGQPIRGDRPTGTDPTRRHCNRCDQIKALDDFPPSAAALPAHRAAYCRPCINEWRRQSRQRLATTTPEPTTTREDHPR